MRTLSLTARQQRRAEILTRLGAGALGVGDAAELLGVSPRQVRRLRQRFAQDGMGAVVHRNQGRRPVNRTDPTTVGRIRALVGAGGKYHDLNVCHLQELLARHEQIALGRSTLDRLLKQEGLRPTRRDPPRAQRRRRERKEAEGMLVQIDASLHDWLEGRGPKLALLGGIDDATGKVVALHFEPGETQAGYLRLVRTIAVAHGLPLAYYHDSHTILRSPKEPTLEEELAGTTPMSQVQRVFAELGVESIAARSPQAKGRIERLWGTLQDRLIKELRLADVRTLEEANAFLPGFIARFNARFARPPADPAAAWVPLPEGCDLVYYFAARETRQVRADHCLTWQGQLLQLRVAPDEPSLVGKRVAVHVVPEGDLVAYAGKRRLSYQRVEQPAGEQAHAPARPPARAARPSDPQAAARKRAWLFGDRASRQTLPEPDEKALAYGHSR
jgi:transposase